MSVESGRSYADRGGKENQVKSLDTCRELSGIALFNLGLQEQPFYSYAIIPLACKYEEKVDGTIVYNVREARSITIRREAELYPSNVRVYYWPSGMCREPVFDAFVDDFVFKSTSLTLKMASPVDKDNFKLPACKRSVPMIANGASHT